MVRAVDLFRKPQRPARKRRLSGRGGELALPLQRPERRACLKDSTVLILDTDSLLSDSRLCRIMRSHGPDQRLYDCRQGCHRRNRVPVCRLLRRFGCLAAFELFLRGRRGEQVVATKRSSRQTQSGSTLWRVRPSIAWTNAFGSAIDPDDRDLSRRLNQATAAPSDERDRLCDCRRRDAHLFDRPRVACRYPRSGLFPPARQRGGRLLTSSNDADGQYRTTHISFGPPASSVITEFLGVAVLAFDIGMLRSVWDASPLDPARPSVSSGVTAS